MFWIDNPPESSLELGHESQTRICRVSGRAWPADFATVIGLLFAANDCITYAVQPLTTKILGGWIIGDVLMFAIAGVIVGALYKPGATNA
jgi:hypothetical protein